MIQGRDVTKRARLRGSSRETLENDRDQKSGDSVIFKKTRGTRLSTDRLRRDTRREAAWGAHGAEERLQEAASRRHGAGNRGRPRPHVPPVPPDAFVDYTYRRRRGSSHLAANPAELVAATQSFETFVSTKRPSLGTAPPHHPPQTTATSAVTTPDPPPRGVVVADASL